MNYAQYVDDVILKHLHRAMHIYGLYIPEIGAKSMITTRLDPINANCDSA